MRLSEAIMYREAIVKSAEGLSDEEILKTPKLVDPWAAGEEYKEGQRVRYPDTEEAKIYKCIQPHPSQIGWEPTVAPSLWAEVLIPNPDIIPDWKQPESTNPYKKGDKVRYKGKVWVSTCDRNVWEPGVQGWEDFS